ncbi:unnamed protein product [Caretta caretta]
MEREDYLGCKCRPTKFLGNRKSHIVQDFKEPSFIFVDTSNQQWCPNNQFKLLEKRLLYKRHERTVKHHISQLTSALKTVQNSPPSLSLETNQNGKLIKGGLSLRSVSNVTIHIR